MIYQKGLVKVFRASPSDYNVKNLSKGLTEPTSGEDVINEAVTQELPGSSSCESPKQVSFSSEGLTESPSGEDVINEAVTQELPGSSSCESPKQVSFSSEESPSKDVINEAVTQELPGSSCESPKQVSFSSEGLPKPPGEDVINEAVTQEIPRSSSCESPKQMSFSNEGLPESSGEDVIHEDVTQELPSFSNEGLPKPPSEDVINEDVTPDLPSFSNLEGTTTPQSRKIPTNVINEDVTQELPSFSNEGTTTPQSRKIPTYVINEDVTQELPSFSNEGLPKPPGEDVINEDVTQELPSFSNEGNTTPQPRKIPTYVINEDVTQELPSFSNEGFIIEPPGEVLMHENVTQELPTFSNEGFIIESPGEVLMHENVTQELIWSSPYEGPQQMSFSSEGTAPVASGNKSLKRKLSSETFESKPNRCCWDNEADTCLLSYLKQNKDKILKLNNPHSSVKEGLWYGASEWMSNFGFNYSETQCYNRWKNNKQHYTSDIFLLERIPEPEKSTGRCNWGYEANICLLKYLERNKKKIRQLSNPHSNVKDSLWGGASDWMLVNGYIYSQKQCSNRWKNDKQQYNKGINNGDGQFKATIIKSILGQCCMSLHCQDE
ncbi:unnamed protein product [Rhizophagus irregularis]|uniref:Myb-like domain-containing protein n=2 Tax=Rhizophagus irregularis TaxID=588596 RepID=A0A916E4R1_9GLOM|nr:unnamed protein product [Rhizophagus irregularis]CAB5189042.1 unnamed protein product [Rhizophagus irregularis]CAB5362164.1 unnamed protein product [Rhizophagus irregularis]